MVRAQLQRAKECSQRSSDPHITSQGVPYATDKWRCVDQSPHLGYVSCVDNQEEVGRESIGQACDDTNPGVNTHKYHSDHHQHHSPQRHISRRANSLNDWRGGLFNILLGILHIDKISWHTRKHRASPLRILATMFAGLLDILRHTSILRNVTLR